MKAFSVIGTKETGKTTTIEYLIKELKRRRYSIGSIKDIHYDKFAIDTEGTNTHRHKKAGSELVTARGYRETDILFPRQLDIETILGFYDHDFVIMEGVTDYNVPMVLCLKEKQGLKDYKDQKYFSRIFAVSGVVASTEAEVGGIRAIDATKDISGLADLIEQKVYDVLPDFPPDCCDACGHSCRELGARILKGLSVREDCVIKDSDIKLEIDGKEIEIVPFVQDLLRDTLLGVVGNLKGYKKGKSIKITIGHTDR